MDQDGLPRLAHARLALDDARHVVGELCALQGDEAAWLVRARWVAALAFIRLIGHVIPKVDEPNLTSAQAGVSQAWWKALHPPNPPRPEDAIFHEFIKRERDIILKEYDLRFPWRRRLLTFGGRPLTVGGRPLSFGGAFMVADGHFRGREALELCDEALTWWAAKIEALEADMVLVSQ